MNIAEIRQRFVGYYESMGFQSLPSAPMIDPSIPMSFVMSAGLVQVENSLAKTNQREGNQYVLVQNCFRHFDLEKVGTDDIHLSLFEMPGAFVFGPDGKNETVQRMWKLATEVLGIEKERIWISYFKGGQVMGDYLAEDIITRRAWMDLGVPEKQIIGLGTDNNYWIQGKGIEDTSITRKCGPNTELFYDRGFEKACGKDCRPGCKCGRFVEFSNSLFICSEIRQNNGHIQPLENPFTETVIGAERVSMIRQKADSVFEIDEFKPIFATIKSLVDRNNLPEDSIVNSERVIADHLRGLFYLIAGGAPPPGKNGRERIIKMLIRRVITRLIVLGINVQKYIPILTMSITRNIHDINQKDKASNLLVEYFLSEFQRFAETINRGHRQLTLILDKNNGNTLTGQQIMYLEKKWGLPSLITAVFLHQRDLPFNNSAYMEALITPKDTNSNLLN